MSTDILILKKGRLNMNITSKVKTFLFEEDRPFASCHASTVLALDNGDILVAYFAGTRESANDVDIWISKRENDIWKKPVKVVEKEGLPLWNPVLFQRENGEIVLFYKQGKPIVNWYTMVTTSMDNGKSWSVPEELIEGDIGGRGPVKNKPIILHDGTWLAPASVEGEFWDCFVDHSSDEGKTWQASELVPVLRKNNTNSMDKDINPIDIVKGKGIIQPTLWESEPNHVHMLTRSTSGFMYRSDSTDGGHTWSTAYNAYLPNNNSGFDLTQLDNGTLVLVYNPVGIYSKGARGPRTPLLLSVSYDNGHTWEEKVILDEEGTGVLPAGFAYPAIISKDNRIMVTYTWNRERIVFWEIEFNDKGRHLS